MTPDSLYRLEFESQIRRAALILGSPQLASDVVHDAFAAVLEHWGSIENHGAYLQRAVVNGCTQAFRTESRDRRLDERLERERLHAPTDNEPLWDVLLGLPINQRTAVVLKYYGGFTESEIAEAMSCPTGSVGPWIRRALTSLRGAL